MRTRAASTPNSSATTCATLGVEPLSHLGTAVVDLDRAVRIEVYERAGLVEVLEGEGDAELDGG